MAGSEARTHALLLPPGHSARERRRINNRRLGPLGHPDTGAGSCLVEHIRLPTVSRPALLQTKTNGDVFASLAGIEPAAFGLEVRRAFHCATGTSRTNTVSHPNTCTRAAALAPPMCTACTCNQSWSRGVPHDGTHCCHTWSIASPRAGAFKNCRGGLCFKSPRRGIGKSFQLAIIAPRLDLIGYDIATAQS